MQDLIPLTVRATNDAQTDTQGWCAGDSRESHTRGDYIVESGRLTLIIPTKKGPPDHEHLCNFDAWIKEQIYYMTGKHDTLDHIVVRIACRRPLSNNQLASTNCDELGIVDKAHDYHEVTVNATDFDDMKWVSKLLGKEYSIAAHNKDHTRAAIESLSGVIIKTIGFDHLGWIRTTTTGTTFTPTGPLVLDHTSSQPKNYHNTWRIPIARTGYR